MEHVFVLKNRIMNVFSLRVFQPFIFLLCMLLALTSCGVRDVDGKIERARNIVSEELGIPIESIEFVEGVGLEIRDSAILFLINSDESYDLVSRFSSVGLGNPRYENLIDVLGVFSTFPQTEKNIVLYEHRADFHLSLVVQTDRGDYIAYFYGI